MPEEVAERLLSVVPFKKKETPKPEELFNGVLDMLAKIAAEIIAGTVSPSQVVVFYMEKQPNGNFKPTTWFTGCSVPDRMAYAELLKANALEEWRN